jgi:hypothetical protein
MVITMCLSSTIDETFTSIPTDVDEIIALQEHFDALVWEQWCEIAHEQAVDYLEERGL